MSRKLAAARNPNIIDLQTYRARSIVPDRSSGRSHVSIVMNSDGYIDADSEFANPYDAARMLDALLCLVVKARRVEHGEAI